MFHSASRVLLFRHWLKVAVNASLLFGNLCHLFAWNSYSLVKLSNKETCDKQKDQSTADPAW